MATIRRAIITTKTDQQLWQAASEGNLSGVIEALNKGADVNARGPLDNTALNQAAEQGHIEIVKRLLEVKADIHNVGGADKTPIMNAAFAGNVEIVQLLLEKGALVTNDLLSSVQLKVNILEENAELGMVNPKAVEAWKGFLGFLVTARLEQDLPEIVKGLSTEELEERKTALARIESAAKRGIDVSAAVPRLCELASDQDAETRSTVGAVLSTHYVQDRDWDRLRELFETRDQKVKVGAIPMLVSAAQDGVDVSPLVPTIVNLLS
ncbi:MAG: ankyrin repeat domain-containing protein, partial [Anaerolineae bacterium]